jgi:glutamine amidotransferase
MCRHLAYAGAPVRLGALLQDPPFSLVQQSWAPRRQTHGLVNVDGFGVGWYVDGDPVPARHRAAGPVWSDETFADLCRVVRTPALLAAVRSATPGLGFGAGAAFPFRRGRWLFSHNGAIPGWPESGRALAGALDVTALASLDAATDAAVLWALVQHRLFGPPAEQAGDPAVVLADVVRQVAAVTDARLNLLVTDGEQIAATAWGASLYWRALPGGVLVASEPHDDEPGWNDVPEGSVLSARGPHEVLVKAI